jgi:hypothetical protein
MNSDILLIKIKEILTPYLGIYVSINKPAIWVGLPPNNLLPSGLEVIIPRYADYSKGTNTRIVSQYWSIRLNQYQSSGTDTIFSALDALKLALKPMPRITFIEKPNVVEIKNIPIVPSAIVDWENTELYQIGNR